MLENSSILYKMIVLYMLENIDFSLTNSQITNFFLDREYTTYFHVQETIHDLKESGLIEEKQQGTSILYNLTDEGKKTISYFSQNIPGSIRQEINAYLKEHGHALRNQNSVVADYYRTPQREYTVQCRVQEKQTTLINLELTVPTEEIAMEFCKHWPKKCDEIYAWLMQTLS